MKCSLCDGQMKAKHHLDRNEIVTRFAVTGANGFAIRDGVVGREHECTSCGNKVVIIYPESE